VATLGIDIGNYNVKTSSGQIFNARYSTKQNLLETNLGLEIDGMNYDIGSGYFETKLNKAEKQNILPLLYTAILRSTNYSLVNIVLGLPIAQYKQNKDNLKSIITASRMASLRYKGEKKIIIIENIEIFPEGAGAYYSLEDKPNDCIVLDIGGRTTNIINFHNKKIVKSDSKALGMINLYADVRDNINSKYSLDLKIENIENVLRDGLWIDGQKIDMSFLKPIVEDLIDELMNELNLNYPIRIEETLLTGGGAFLLYSALQKRINRITRLENYLFANAIGFKRVGDNLWNEEE
jgi:plasmid segregation protein ParM